ncbi:MAG: GNVR domain-containing protein [Pirellulaceae bacterium]|nr:GNVR domain-containing protein [Pirellulaceae bacterium]
MYSDSSKRLARPTIPRVNFSRRDFYGQLCRHRKLSIGTFLAVMTGAIYISFASPKIYQSQSLLYVRLGRENVRLDPTTTLGQASLITIPNSRESEINSVVEILKSRAIAEKVVDALGPQAILDDAASDEPAIQDVANDKAGGHPSSFRMVVKGILESWGIVTPVNIREQAIIKLGKGFSTRALSKSDLLSLSYRANSPSLAQRIVLKFTETYLNEHAGLNRPPNAHQFLEQQTERLWNELTQSEKELKDLKQETDLASPDSQRELLVTRLHRLQDELLTAETLAIGTSSEIEALHQKLKELKESHVEAVTTGQSNPAADGMRQLLYSLQLQENRIASTYTSDYPLLASIREQIDQSKAILKQEQDARQTVMEGPNRAFEELNITRMRQEALLMSTQAKAAALKEQIATAKQQFQTQIENELRIARIQRDVQLQDTSYRKYFDNLEQAHIDQALENERISNINVIQPASFVEKPVGPNILLNLLAGLFGGIIAAIGVAILRDTLDHSLKSPEEIEEKLNLPLLVSIPRLNKRKLQLTGRNGE